jgi:hypothetical protein
MTAAVISFSQARASRGYPAPVVIRIGDRVRRRCYLAEGTVVDIVGFGTPSDPVRALVQFEGKREIIAVASLHHAPRLQVTPFTPSGAPGAA